MRFCFCVYCRGLGVRVGVFENGVMELSSCNQQCNVKLYELVYDDLFISLLIYSI